MLPNHFVGKSISGFLDRVYSSVKLNRLRDFRNESEIKEACQTERRKTLENLMKCVSDLGMEDICTIVKNADEEIMEYTRQIILKNEEFRNESESLLEHVVNYLVKEFESNILLHLSLNPYMKMEKLERLLEKGVQDAMQSYHGQWKPGTAEFRLVFERKLKSEIECIRNVVIEHQTRFLVEVEKVEYEGIRKLGQEIVDKLGLIKTDLEKDKIQVKRMENVKELISDHEEFFNFKYCQVHYELFELVAEAEKDLFQTVGASSRQYAVLLVDDLLRKVRNAILRLTESPEEKDKRIQVEVMKLVESKVNQYKSQMGDILDTSKKGRDPIKLERDHKAILKRLKNSLEFEIRRISPQEATDGHCKTVKTRINDHWISVKKQNEEKLKVVKKVKEEEHLNSSKPSPQSDPINVPDPVFDDANAKENQLVFKLSNRHVMMGATVDGIFQVVENGKGSATTPFIVAKNSSGELLYGREAAKCVSSKENNSSVEHWWIYDYFGTSSFDPAKKETKLTIGFKSFSCELSVEFLLSYFLRSLKEHAEKQLSVKFTNAIVTIPLWFCSMHRIQIKDAAKIAGFEECHLFNEESAVAYAFHSAKVKTDRERKRGEYFLVLSETTDVVSATLYNVYLNKLGIEELSMHSFSFSRGILESLSSGSAATFVRKVCDAALEKDEHSPTSAVFLTEDPAWLQAFYTVAKEKGWEQVEIKDRVMLGALRCGFEGARKFFLEILTLDVYKQNLSWGNSVGVAIPEEKSKNICMESEPHEVKLQYGQRETKYFQKSVLAMDREVCIGTLWIGHSVYKLQEVRPVFDISCEGIVTLKEVKIVPESETGEEDEFSDFTWKTPNMKDEQKKKLSEDVDAIILAMNSNAAWAKLDELCAKANDCKTT